MLEKKVHLINFRELILILIVFLIAVSSFLIIRIHKNYEVSAIIKCGDISETVSLSSENRVFEIDGINSTFEIKDGEIRIIEAQCPDKICEKTGYISSLGQSIICVPEKITVTVVSSGNSDNKADVTVG